MYTIIITTTELRNPKTCRKLSGGGASMIRVDRKELTKKEIIRVAAKCFLNDGYAKTTVNSMCKTLNMSPGNMTFHFPTKEHLLAELVDMLCKFQAKIMIDETKEGYSSIMAICLELLTIASACEQDEVAKEFFLISYTSPLSMEIIRQHDKERAKEVFKDYCPDWSDEKFAEAEVLVSGIEYGTLMTTKSSASLEFRIAGALDTILRIYNVPQDTRKQKIERVLSMDYKTLGLKVLDDFKKFVDTETEQALLKLLSKK